MCGFFVSVGMVVLAISYLFISIKGMNDMKDDIYNSQILINNFDEGENEFNMYYDSYFTPSIALSTFGEKSES